MCAVAIKRSHRASAFQELRESEALLVVLFVDGGEVDVQVLFDGLHGLDITEIGVGVVEDEEDIICREKVRRGKLHDADNVLYDVALSRG